FSAVGPTTVYADDSAPPTTPTTPTDPTGGGSDPGVTDPEPATEPVIALPPDGTPPPAEPDTAEPTPENSTDPIVEGGEQPQPTEAVPPVVEETAPPVDTNILEQVPENTTVTVLNAEGQAQPLATQDAATAIEITSDPIWCPAAQTTPTPGANGCTVSFTSFTDLLTELAGNVAYQGAGTIYVQQGAYNGGESVIDFNSFDLSNISSSALTVQGGWNTANNTVDPASSSTLNVAMIIGTSANPWGGSLSFNNINFSNVTSGTALVLNSQQDISVSTVNITDSTTGNGAELNAGGNISVSNSRFERNRNAGAVIQAGGNVSISDSTFGNPGTNRAQITGVDITSGGSVSLFNVLANGNREVGAHINAAQNVSITDSFFSENQAFITSPTGETTFFGYGLHVVTPGAISLDGVTANGNFLWGASLDALGNVTIANSIFNGNSSNTTEFIDDTGLIVRSGGNVTLDAVQANDNPMIGADIQATGTVAISNSDFSNNRGSLVSSTGVVTFFGYGLQVISGGTINLDGVTASNNRLFGAHLESGADITIANSSFDNQSSGSPTDLTGRGLEVVTTGGIVTLFNVTASNNQLFGMNIQAPGNVFLDQVTATNNGTNGVEVDTACTFLNSGTFTGNGQYGLSLVNPVLTQSGSPVFSGNGAGDIFPAVTTPCPVAVSGGNTGGVSTGNGTTGNGTTGNTSGQSHLVSLSTSFMGKGLGVANSAAMSLNGLFTNNYQFTVSTSKSGSVTTIGIFTGKYAYIHSSSGLQIVLLQPVSYTGAWMGAGS
ncbi:MAG: right-handed parallel beta-helix repeat-containing protein, partial [Anaerolineales bacterium]